MRLYYDSEGLDISNVANIRVYTSSSKAGTFTLVDQVVFDPMYDYVTVSSSRETLLLNWFKLSLIDKSGVESVRTGAFVSDSLSRIIAAVREGIGDTGNAYSDDDYISKIKESLKVHTGSEYVESINESDIGFIIQLVMISCCYDLALDNARYSRITLPDGISLDKGERVKHYLDIAERLQKRYDTLTGKVKADSGSNLTVGQASRHNYFKRGFGYGN